MPALIDQIVSKIKEKHSLLKYQFGKLERGIWHFHPEKLSDSPAVADFFYPGNPSILRKQIKDYLNSSLDSEVKIPKAIIAPHAGYQYSGAVAATAYRTLLSVKSRIERVVLLGPAHRVPLYGLAASSADYFATPLGQVPVDISRIQQLLLQFDYLQILDDAHASEHSLEVHLPFLQEILDDFVLIPLVVGDATGSQIGDVLDTLWGGMETLMVISSDLSHYHNYATAQSMDLETAGYIERFEGDKLDYESACGRNPIQGLLTVAQKRQLRIQRLKLCNSGG